MNFYKIEDEIKFSHKRYELINKTMEKIIARGYFYWEPVLFENYDSFVAENNRIDSKSTVKVLSNDGSISILTPDLTSGMLSNILDKCDEKTKLKILYYGKVFKNTELGIKEIRQLGAEYLGEEDISADLEIIDMALEIMGSLKQDYIMEIGCSNFLKQLIKELGLSTQSYMEIMEIIYKKDKYKLEKYVSGFHDSEAKKILENLFQLSGSFEAVREALQNLGAGVKTMDSINHMELVDRFIKQKGLEKNVVYDLSVVSELDYYSGITFRTYMKNANDAIIKGGRYKASSPKVQNEITAVGFSVEVDILSRIL
ncbi:MAG: ATP phosphoribosyltransferase regulatory subunit [Proteocatella sp.]